MAASPLLARNAFRSPKALLLRDGDWNVKSAAFTQCNTLVSDSSRFYLRSLPDFRYVPSSKRVLVCVPRAMDASVGSSGGYSVFPRISVKDPYKRLGLSREASTEEIQEARNYLIDQYGTHEQSRESIEDAYDRIIAEKFRVRKQTKINLKADLKKKVSESPPWVQSFFSQFESPPSPVIFQRFFLFAIIGVWSVMNPTEGGPTFQVAVALAASVYLLNDKVKSLGRAFFLAFIGLAIGWVTGSLFVPLLQDYLPPTFWSLELGTSLISYFFLWLVTTFMK